MKKKMYPYSVYLPQEYYEKIRDLAKERKASSLVRDAIMMALEGDNAYKAAYNQGLRDAIKAIDSCKEIEVIAIRGKYLADVLAEQIGALEMN
jgi:Arc/MetJ-type ribon-helix-helix transcriptional regulator